MDETTLLNHYKIPSLYPSEFPADKDREDASDDELPAPSSRMAYGPPAQLPNRSRSRYSVLERPSGRRSIQGFERTKEGVDNLVQKDEADPLGSSTSVVQVLRGTGLPVEQDMKLSTWDSP